MAIRTYGLSGSGMDVDQMVKDLMKARRASYDKTWQKKTQIEYKKADYNSMYTTLRDFRNNTVFNNKLQSTVMPKKVASANETVVTASANSEAANVSHTIEVTELASGVTKSSSASITTGDSKDTLSTQFGVSGMIDLKINDKAISVDSGKSIYELVSAINNADAGVKANYDATLDRFFLYSKNTGAEAKIDFTGTSEAGNSFLTDKLKLTTEKVSGKDSEFTLDGVPLTQSSNNFTISGVTYNLKTKGTSNVSVSADNDKAITNAKAFVEAYNTTLNTLNTKLKETKYSDYLPLTTEQKTDMKDTEITEWEKRAKSGLLRRDPILQDAVYKMRNDVVTPVSGISGSYTSLASIGVTTGDYSEGGKLYLDETKLKQALEADPDAVSKLLSTTGDTWEKQGVAVRLYDTLKSAMDKIAAEAGYSGTIDDDSKSALAKRIISYNTELSRMNDRLGDVEKRYYKQFDAMEAALSKMSQQSSWLSQQLGQ